MLALHGAGVSDGIAIGRACLLVRELPDIVENVLPPEQIDDEIARFQHAVDAARQQLIKIRDHIPAGAPAEAASFLDTHVLILDDKMISEAPVAIIRDQRRNAEWALKVQRDLLSGMFERMEDPYLRNKKTDVAHVVDRVLRNLLNVGSDEDEELGDSEIVIANDLTPADTVVLKAKQVRAFVTNMGGPISHTAILARSLGIPAIVSVHNATRYVRHGAEKTTDIANPPGARRYEAHVYPATPVRSTRGARPSHHHQGAVAREPGPIVANGRRAAGCRGSAGGARGARTAR